MTFDQIAWYCSMTVSTTDFAWPLHAVPWRPRPPNGSNASRVRVNNLLMVGLWKDRRSKFCPIGNIFTDSRCSCLTVFHGSWIALFLHFYRFLYISCHFLTHFNPSILCASSSKRRWSLPGVCSPHCTGGRWQAKFQQASCLPAKSWAVTSAIKEQCAHAITKGSHHIEAKF